MMSMITNVINGKGSPRFLLFCVCCSQVGRDNPAELKAQKLARGLQRGVLDRDLKPNSEERRRLQVRVLQNLGL